MLLGATNVYQMRL